MKTIKDTLNPPTTSSTTPSHVYDRQTKKIWTSRCTAACVLCAGIWQTVG